MSWEDMVDGEYYTRPDEWRLIWNLRMWIRSRGYIEYYRQPVTGRRWTDRGRHWRSNLVNQLYQEYAAWNSLTGSGSSSSYLAY
jgi:hypothetical protein